MWDNKRSTLTFQLLFLFIGYTYCLSVPTLSVPKPNINIPKPNIDIPKPNIDIPKPNISLPNPSLTDSLDAVKNLNSKVMNPLDILNDIGDHIPDPIDTVKNLSAVAVTTAVFTKNNVTLNCFGLPVNAFASVIEKIFTQTTKAQDVRFYFSSRKQVKPITYRVDNFTLENNDFDVTRPTVVISHGFMSNGREAWLTEMKDAFLKLDDVNVIVVDWQRGSNTWNYYSAAISTRIVGLQIAKLFAKIRETVPKTRQVPDFSNWGTLYFVGHSLGSHISAHAAYLVKESQKNLDKKWLVTRITGLDPAQPCFTTADQTLKLDKDDAPFVDVIHTNARHILFLGLGLPDQLGYVDFYPNGGEVQPGCTNIDTSIWDFLLLPKTIIQESICSHGRSHDFLTESLSNIASGSCSFIGYTWDKKSKHVAKILNEKCVSGLCTEMGVNSASYYPKNSGIFFVPTRHEAPYCGANEDGRQVFHVEPSKNILSRWAKKIGL